METEITRENARHVPGPKQGAAQVLNKNQFPI